MIRIDLDPEACEFADGRLACAECSSRSKPAAATHERSAMRTQVQTVAVVWLVLSHPVVPMTKGCQASGSASQDSAENSAEKPAQKATSLRMSPGVVCRSIDGYEQYERLLGAAQTSEEKLLVYLRPLGYMTEPVDGEYQAHLAPDFQIRKHGEKAILRQKKKAFEYKPKSRERPRLIYLKNVISLKGLPPGDYDLTIILHDEVAKGATATQVVKFRIVPPVEPQKKDEASQPDDRPAAPSQPS